MRFFTKVPFLLFVIGFIHIVGIGLWTSWWNPLTWIPYLILKGLVGFMRLLS